MLRINHLLLPTDFSECAESAFSHAVLLAERYGAVLHVLNVRSPQAEDLNDPMDYLPMRKEDDRTWSDAYERAADERGVSIVHVQTLEFSPVVGILDYADRHGVDLIVMGTHGRHGLDRLLIGSTAEEVIRLATCPVLSVRQEATLQYPSVERADGERPRFLVPVDFSETARPAITYAKELAATYGAHLDLVHVVENLNLPGIYGIEPPPLNLPQVNLRSRWALREAAAEAGGPDVPVEVHVLTDEAAHGILGFAEQQGTDLIVIATHGWSGVKRLLLGSVTDRVVRTAPCPVFTVKSYGKSLIVPDAPQQSAVKETEVAS